MTGTTEIDYDALNELVRELTTREPGKVEEELLDAGDFVAQYGLFGDLFEEPALTRAQFARQVPAAWGLLGHWSVERNDPAPDPPAEFEDHVKTCQTCDYLEGVLGLRMMFEYESCDECHLGLDAHDVGPDPIGKAHAWCREGQWERVEPFAAPAGQVSEYQMGDAYCARWTAPLTDGTFAVVTRSYFIARQNDGQITAQREDEYVVCRDPADPGSTEVAATYDGDVLESDDPAAEDTYDLAVQSFEPEPSEWQTTAPEFARALLQAAAR